MTKPNPMFIEKPFSLAHARRMFGGSDPVKLALLSPLLYFDYSVFVDEFSYLDSSRFTTAVTAGGGPTAFAFSAARGGQIQGATGATDDDATAIHYTNTFFDPEDNPFFLLQWKANVVTNFSFEIGFSDPKTDEALPGVTDVDTPTVGNGVTDLLAVHMDTDQDLTSAALVGDGTTGAATKEDLYLGNNSSNSAYSPTAGQWQTFLIGVRDNLGYAAIWDGEGFVGRFGVANAPDANVLVRPYALFRTRNTSSKTIDIRKWIVGQEMDF